MTLGIRASTCSPGLPFLGLGACNLPDTCAPSHRQRYQDGSGITRGARAPVFSSLLRRSGQHYASDVRTVLVTSFASGICIVQQRFTNRRVHTSQQCRHRCLHPRGSSNSSSSTKRPTAMQHGWGPASVPISLMSDSYKASHYLQYPETSKMVAVGGTSTSIRAIMSAWRVHALTLYQASDLPRALRFTAVWGIPRGV